LFSAVKESGIYVSSLDGKENRRILADVSSVVLGAGRLLFVRENMLVAQPFDTASRQITGDVVPVAESVSFIRTAHLAPVTVSETGVLLYESGGRAGGNQMLWYDRDGKLLEAIGGPGPVFEPAIAPDEKSVAFRRTRTFDSAAQKADLWLRDLTRGTAT